MAKSIGEYTDPKELRKLMVNAKRLKRDDVWREAFECLCILSGLDQADPLHRDFYATLGGRNIVIDGRSREDAIANVKLYVDELG